MLQERCNGITNITFCRHEFGQKDHYNLGQGRETSLNLLRAVWCTLDCFTVVILIAIVYIWANQAYLTVFVSLLQLFYMQQVYIYKNMPRYTLQEKKQGCKLKHAKLDKIHKNKNNAVMFIMML